MIFASLTSTTSLYSFEDHTDHVRKVLQKLRANGIKLKAKKCVIRHEVSYLGHIISADGYRLYQPRPQQLQL